MTDTKKQRRST